MEQGGGGWMAIDWTGRHGKRRPGQTRSRVPVLDDCTVLGQSGTEQERATSTQYWPCVHLAALGLRSPGPSGEEEEVEGTDRTPEQLGGFWRHCDLCLVSERATLSGRVGGPDGATVGRWAVAKA